GDDVLAGGGGNDSLAAGLGDDLYDFSGTSLGTDSIVEYDNEGYDFFTFRYFGGSVDLDLADVNAQVVNSGNLAIDLYSGSAIEGVTASNYDDTIYGNSLNNYFVILRGEDHVEGRSGNDVYVPINETAGERTDTIVEDSSGGSDVLYLYYYPS